MRQVPVTKRVSTVEETCGFCFVTTRVPNNCQIRVRRPVLRVHGEGCFIPPDGLLGLAFLDERTPEVVERHRFDVPSMNAPFDIHQSLEPRLRAHLLKEGNVARPCEFVIAKLHSSLPGIELTP